VYGNGVALATADGGTTWIRQTLPQGAQDLYSVSCRSVGDCRAVGVGAVMTLHAETGIWSPVFQLPVPSSGPYPYLNSVSCPTSGPCWAAGQTPAGSLLVSGPRRA